MQQTLLNAGGVTVLVARDVCLSVVLGDTGTDWLLTVGLPCTRCAVSDCTPHCIL
jgi:hypothetical protein